MTDLLCHCHDNSYAAGSVLIMTKISRFYLKQGLSTHTNLMESVKTIWEPCVFRARPSGQLKKVADGDIWFFTERDWSQECCHGNNIVGVILFLLGCTLLVPSFIAQNSIVFLDIYLQCEICDKSSIKKDAFSPGGI